MPTKVVMTYFEGWVSQKIASIWRGGKGDGSIFFALCKQSFDEGVGVEFGDVCGFFAEADKFDGYIELVLDGDNDSATGCSVELCQEYACNVNRLGEHLRLCDSVLACCGIENKQDFIWGIGDFAGGNITDFCQLSHQVLLCVQSACGIEDKKICFSGEGGFTGIEGDGGSISNCYSTGAVSGTSASGPSYFVGGLVGSNGDGIISNCYSTGAVSGSYYVGGLAGYNGGSVSNCYSTGAVTGGDYSTYLGGLVGHNWGSISDCYSTGAVSCGPGSSYVGGLVGYNYYDNDYSGSISGCYFLVTSGLDNGLGTPLTNEEMKQQSSFVGWDFTNETANGTNDYWRMCVDGVDYPRLNWESIAGDFMCPDGVNVEDLDYFVQRWLLGDCTLENNYCGGADIDGSGVVDFADFAIFAQHWL